MILRGKGFILRPAKNEDVESFYKNKNDKALENGFVSFVFPYSILKARIDLKKIILKNKEKDNEIFIIDIDGEAVGEIGLNEIIPKLKAKLYYWIGKEYRRKGITSRAVKLIVKYGEKKYGLRRVYAWLRVHNKASRRVLDKTGFKLEGVMKKSVLKKGKYYDDYLYARVR